MNFPITTLKTSLFLKAKLRYWAWFEKKPSKTIFTLSFFKKYNFGFWKKIGSCHHHFMASIYWAAVDAVLLDLRKFLCRSLSFRNIKGTIIIHNFNHNDIYFMSLTWRIRDETKMTICLHTQIIFVYDLSLLLKLFWNDIITEKKHQEDMNANSLYCYSKFNF